MIRGTDRRFAFFLLLLFACGAGLAEELWISTSPPVPRAGQPVEVRLMLGGDFSGEEQAYDSGSARRFQRVWRNGRENLRGVEGQIPAARFHALEPGVQLLSFEGLASRGSGTAHYCKAVVVVEGAAAGSPLRWSELGQRLEIVPQTDPVELLAGGGSLEVQVLFEREPLARAVVQAIPEADPSSSLSARTDEIGVARFRLERQGAWMIRVSTEAPCYERVACPTEWLSSTLILARGN